MPKKKSPLRGQDNQLTTSFALNRMWRVLLFPAVPFSFMAGVSTLMLSDPGAISTVRLCLITVVTGLFWATPVIIVIAIKRAKSLARQSRFSQAISVQLLPFLYIFITFCLLFLIA